MPELDRATAFAFLSQLAAVAARETLPRFRMPLVVDNKAHKAAFDPLTEADCAAEAALRECIEEQFPEHGIIGEEYDDKMARSRWSWIIDPIDGTRSFICGMPTWGTLVGVLEHGVPRFGMMSQPYVGECFIGGDGEARLLSTHGERALECRAGRALDDASLYATTPEMFAPGDELDAFNRLSARVRLTRFGADCYAYCLLAAGYVDLVVEADLGFYDIAPLVPIVSAAGGEVSDWEGRPVRRGGRAIAAADASLHAAALAILKGQA